MIIKTVGVYWAYMVICWIFLSNRHVWSVHTAALMGIYYTTIQFSCAGTQLRSTHVAFCAMCIISGIGVMCLSPWVIFSSLRWVEMWSIDNILKLSHKCLRSSHHQAVAFCHFRAPLRHDGLRFRRDSICTRWGPLNHESSWGCGLIQQRMLTHTWLRAG